MTLVYISGPITEAKAAISMANELYLEGFHSYIPVINYHSDLLSNKSIHNWFESNIVILEKCDCLLSLIGTSVESDAEVAYAHETGKPVFKNYKELVTFFREGS